MVSEVAINSILVTSVFLAAYTIVVGVLRSAGLKARVSKVVEGNEKDGIGLKIQTVNYFLNSFSAIVANFGTILKFEASSGAETIKKKLYMAGFREDRHLVIFMLIKYTGTIVIFILSIFLSGISIGNEKITGVSSAIVCGSTIIFFLGCDFILSKIIEKRKLAISEALPDCLDLLVVCTEAGLSLDAALHRVASEMVRQSSIMSEEIRVTVLELGFLPERRLALENMGKRIGDDSVNNLVNTLIQSERYGTPLANSLRVISDEIRDKRVMRAEEKAARLPAILTVPMIVFILPTLFIVLAGPAFIEVYDNMK